MQLQAISLRKSFGKINAISDESFTLSSGQVLGLIGRNGAGKSTTFRMLLGLLKPDSGSLLIDGIPMSKKFNQQIGFLPEERGIDIRSSVKNQVLYYAELKGLTKKEALQRLDYWMKWFQVKGTISDRIKSLSKGNQQKIQLISVLIHNPRILILDEPFSGLDPVNSHLLERAIDDSRKNGTAVIFSSHDMETVERLSDSVLMLEQGQVVLNNTFTELRRNFGRTRVELTTKLPLKNISAIPGVRIIKQNGFEYSLTLRSPQIGKEVFNIASRFENGYIEKFVQRTPTLSEIFSESLRKYGSLTLD